MSAKIAYDLGLGFVYNASAMKTLPLVCALASLLPLSRSDLVAATASPAATAEAPIAMAPFVVEGTSAEHAGISLHVVGRWNKDRTGTVIDEPTVAYVFPGSPAERAGIAKGDTIAQVAEVKTKDLELRRWHELFDLRHAAGGTTTLLIRQARSQKTIPLTFRFVPWSSGKAPSTPTP
jgi:C-terminal processing protease CtpA/Prc